MLQISELFHSIQGEGTYTGTPMCFVRLAGCNVGRYIDNKWPVPTDINVVNPDLKLFALAKHSMCTSIDGQRFLCDTDYHKIDELSVEDIMRQVYEDHICLTGGEPFLHKLGELMASISLTDKMLHIETSGTLPIKDVDGAYTWITCCPKEGFLSSNIDFIDEFKFLVGPNFDPACVHQILSSGGEYRPICENVFIQPINGVEEVDEENMARCLKLLESHPSWKLSAQLHKWLKVR